MVLKQPINTFTFHSAIDPLALTWSEENVNKVLGLSLVNCILPVCMAFTLPRKWLLQLASFTLANVFQGLQIRYVEFWKFVTGFLSLVSFWISLNDRYNCRRKKRNSSDRSWFNIYFSPAAAQMHTVSHNSSAIANKTIKFCIHTCSLGKFILSPAQFGTYIFGYFPF